MIKRILPVIVLLAFLGSASFANHTAMVGGFRDGLSMGMRIEEHINENVMYRYGVEATTGEDLSFSGSNPFVLFTGLRNHFAQLGWSPVSAAAGAVGYFGGQTSYGASLSLIFENLNNSKPLFLETGVDYVAGQGHLLFQVGYRFFNPDLTVI